MVCAKAVKPWLSLPPVAARTLVTPVHTMMNACDLFTQVALSLFRHQPSAKACDLLTRL